MTIPDRLARLKENRWLPRLLLLAIVAIGAGLRLVDLGLTAFRSDEGFFWKIANHPISPGDIFTHWMQLQGLSGQFPFVVAFMKWFLDFFGLTASHFTVHLPFALWGTVTILAAYGMGRALGSRWFGLALAWALALNPYHIQFSREAYYYAPLVCGAFLGIWAAIWMLDHWLTRKPVAPLLYGINAVGFFLLTYTTPTGWPVAFLIVLTVLICFIGQFLQVRRGSVKEPRWAVPYLILLFTFLVIGIPLLTADWALKQQIETSKPELVATAQHIFGVNHPFLPYLWRLLTCYAWGDTAVRAAFTAVVLVLGIGVFIRRIRTDKRFLLVLVFLLAGFGMAFLALRSKGGGYSTRYMIAVLPLYLTLLAAGLVFPADLLRFTRNRFLRSPVFVPCILVAASTLLWLPPAYDCTQLTGRAVPYKVINAWVDHNLARGTLIVVDRWFEPWCELRDEPSTNVTYTYTIPNDPVDVYTNYVYWRETVKDFAVKYPESGFLEIAKTYWDVPNAGPWDWPGRHFARHVAFTNEAGLRLRDLGLASRDDFYTANTNRVIVDLFYNTRDDVLAQARAAGRMFVVLYGPGWSYWKNGQGWNSGPSLDYSDWRVMQTEARLDLYNLSDKPAEVFLALMGLSVNGSKQIQFEDHGSCHFAGEKPELCRVGPIRLAPGHTGLDLMDNQWGLNRVPLLVSRIEVAPAEAQAAPPPRP